MSSNENPENTTFQWIMNEGNRLGKGSFGEVYKGNNKLTGEEVAIKMFMAKKDCKELEKAKLLLGKRHKNIISVISVEEQFESYHVLVMEFCSGHNLQEILRLSENEDGLEEQQYLNVLRDLTNAIIFLRQHNIVHRDIKPSNIVKHVDTINRETYKLGDFGTVRLFVEGEEFSTDCGTRPYMDPNCVGKFIPNVTTLNDTVDANIDLWSIGATLYHLATNSLPFEFGSLKTYYDLTMNKAVGVISIKKTSNGTFKHETTLPDSCRLSEALQLHLTPLLARLLQADKKKKWSYEQYFYYVDCLLSTDADNACLDFSKKKFRLFNFQSDASKEFEKRIVQSIQQKSMSYIKYICGLIKREIDGDRYGYNIRNMNQTDVFEYKERFLQIKKWVDNRSDWNILIANQEKNVNFLFADLYFRRSLFEINFTKTEMKLTKKNETLVEEISGSDLKNNCLLNLRSDIELKKICEVESILKYPSSSFSELRSTIVELDSIIGNIKLDSFIRKIEHYGIEYMDERDRSIKHIFKNGCKFNCLSDYATKNLCDFESILKCPSSSISEFRKSWNKLNNTIVEIKALLTR